jgi:hypothetical protein
VSVNGSEGPNDKAGCRNKKRNVRSRILIAAMLTFTSTGMTGRVVG